MERSDEAAYDNTARILGRGTASQGGAYLLPYLQSGHILLLGVLLLASTISYPGDREPACMPYLHATPACHACTLLRRSTPSAVSGAGPPPCSGVASPSPSRAASYPRLAAQPPTLVWQASR